MKIGIPNIITVLYVCLLIVMITYGLEEMFIKMGNVVDIENVFIAFFGIAFFLFLSYWIVFEFKIVQINNKGIDALYPFLLKRKQILWEDVYGVKCSTFGSRYTYRKVLVKGKKGRAKIIEIALTDLEFQNFNSLTDSIPRVKKARRKIDIEQAKDEKSTSIFIFILLVIAVLFLLFQLFFRETKSLFVFILLILFFIFLGQSFRNIMWYLSVLKKKR